MNKYPEQLRSDGGTAMKLVVIESIFTLASLEDKHDARFWQETNEQIENILRHYPLIEGFLTSHSSEPSLTLTFKMKQASLILKFFGYDTCKISLLFNFSSFVIDKVYLLTCSTPKTIRFRPMMRLYKK